MIPSALRPLDFAWVMASFKPCLMLSNALVIDVPLKIPARFEPTVQPVRPMRCVSFVDIGLLIFCKKSEQVQVHQVKVMTQMQEIFTIVSTKVVMLQLKVFLIIQKVHSLMFL